jgi:hypothetical protein
MWIPRWLKDLARRRAAQEDQQAIEEEVAELRANLAASFSRGAPVPAFSPRHTYGGKGTIHKTGAIDIQLDSDAKITGVWFRCLSLPFTVSIDGLGQHAYQPEIAIEEITYADLPREDSSQ